MVVILGDHGTLYYGEKKDKYKKRILSALPATFICLRGNHDRRAGSGEYAHEKRKIEKPEFSGIFYADPDFPNILYTQEFGWYKLGGKDVFMISGAYSVDKFRRLEMQALGFKTYHWFEDEQLSNVEKNCVQTEIQAQAQAAKPFDIMSHTCPYAYRPIDKFLPCVDQSRVDNSMEKWMDQIEKNTKYDHWYCGHWHLNRNVDRIHFLYEDVILYDTAEGNHEGISQ